MDKLEEIFKMQYELNKRIGVDTAAMGDDERVKWVLNYSRALGQENASSSIPCRGSGGRNTRNSTRRTRAWRWWTCCIS